jgi:plasmid stabilization system protein ParE
MNYRIVFAPEAEEQLSNLYQYIAGVASPAIAARYTGSLVDHCESLAMFPQQGTKRDDIRPGLRLTHFKGRVVIAFAIEAEQVSIIGIFYGGQNYDLIL